MNNTRGERAEPRREVEVFVVPPTAGGQGGDTPMLAPRASRASWVSALEAWRLKLQSEATRATYSGQVRSFFGVPGVPDLDALDIDVLDAYAGALRLRAAKEAPA